MEEGGRGSFSECSCTYLHPLILEEGEGLSCAVGENRYEPRHMLLSFVSREKVTVVTLDAYTPLGWCMQASEWLAVLFHKCLFVCIVGFATGVLFDAVLVAVCAGEP